MWCVVFFNCSKFYAELGCVGLYWVGLGWIRLDWIALDWIVLDWITLDWIVLDCVGLGWVGLDWVELDWIGLEWIWLCWVGLDWIGLGWIVLGCVMLCWVGLGLIVLGWVGFVKILQIQNYSPVNSFLFVTCLKWLAIPLNQFVTLTIFIMTLPTFTLVKITPEYLNHNWYLQKLSVGNVLQEIAVLHY